MQRCAAASAAAAPRRAPEPGDAVSAVNIAESWTLPPEVAASFGSGEALQRSDDRVERTAVNAARRAAGWRGELNGAGTRGRR